MNRDDFDLSSLSDEDDYQGDNGKKRSRRASRLVKKLVARQWLSWLSKMMHSRVQGQHNPVGNVGYGIDSKRSSVDQAQCPSRPTVDSETFRLDPK
ncbi:hypothetical protein TNCV_745991 [Trichonephila clavipes]|nr:hypothetical protein TNCV_745991 [Trichonephila clavipes]